MGGELEQSEIDIEQLDLGTQHLVTDVERQEVQVDLLTRHQLE